MSRCTRCNRDAWRGVWPGANGQTAGNNCIDELYEFDGLRGIDDSFARGDDGIEREFVRASFVRGGLGECDGSGACADFDGD